MWPPLVIALQFISLTGPDGQHIDLNPKQIITIREPRGMDSGHFHASVKCLVLTTDGRLVGVTETCAIVKQRIEEK